MIPKKLPFSEKKEHTFQARGQCAYSEERRDMKLGTILQSLGHTAAVNTDNKEFFFLLQKNQQ